MILFVLRNTEGVTKVKKNNNRGKYIPLNRVVNGRMVQDGYFVKPAGQIIGEADITCSIWGRTWDIEVKVGDDRQSEEQKEYQKKVEAAGVIYDIVRTLDEFFEILEIKKTK